MEILFFFLKNLMHLDDSLTVAAARNVTACCVRDGAIMWLLLNKFSSDGAVACVHGRNGGLATGDQTVWARRIGCTSDLMLLLCSSAMLRVCE